MKIIKISLLLRSGHTDHVAIYTDLPSPFPNNDALDNLVLRCEMQKGTGLNYIKTHFKDQINEVEVICAGDGETYTEKIDVC
jgi:hypothetical protein